MLILFGDKTCKKNDKKTLPWSKMCCYHSVSQPFSDRSPVIYNNDRHENTVTVVIITMDNQDILSSLLRPDE